VARVKERRALVQTLVVFDPGKVTNLRLKRLGQLTLDGVPVAIGLVERLPPTFDSASIENFNLVLVEVLALSCNYRDRVIVLRYLRTNDATAPIHIGSDFVGVVKEIGRNVKSLIPEDRVIGNNSYPLTGTHEGLQGVSTNAASAGFLVLHESKLVKVPDSMPLDVAAGFSIAAQTCYSMIRKVSIRGGERCIVTGASSNTALFALATLARMRVETYALTTGLRDFAPLGVRGTIRVKSPVDQSIATNEIVRRIIREHGGADIVIDCFADIYATSVLPLLRRGGKYVTCGIFAQSGMEPRFGVSSAGWRDLLAFLIVNNITIHGNCLGSASDLTQAIADHAELSAVIPCASVLGIADSVEFVARSLARADRFGKVILRYH
jgi:NADPH:quinone reductase-like Zn-dependent oxidoreductase